MIFIQYKENTNAEASCFGVLRCGSVGEGRACSIIAAFFPGYSFLRLFPVLCGNTGSKRAGSLQRGQGKYGASIDITFPYGIMYRIRFVCRPSGRVGEVPAAKEGNVWQP